MDRKRYADNIEYQRERARKREREKRATDKGKLDSNISRAMRKSLEVGKKSRRSWQSIVGYTVGDLMIHLESQFLPGMTWENYGEWHIDHKVPLAAHYYETPDDIDFKKAWAITNLQPLWATDNISKSDSLSSPFQPSLPLAVNDNTPLKEAA
ncbi:hypothetical protein LB521_27885 [Mesorhizobium sp. BR-1-1-8]|uniref:hypothetical protein n=1 Tax=Mesorhizobium sp. BR-1-1-8 TaxID=2876659 RepID=UPI001CCD622D|nr:hypothetical protein [Mesorhizobium sp. BR-1-1-8]MBZ9984959.1 hypothetical protein [Mesorhizobium sp. BR-1-1-8]